MKTIWIIDHYSSEPKHGGVSRQYDFAKELSKRGYKVVIIASSFSHYTHSYISEDNCAICSISDNAYYAYLKTFPYETNRGTGRIKSMFSFKRAVRKYCGQIAEQCGKPDVVVGCSIHPLAWLAAYKVAKKYNVKFIAEVRDLWPEMWRLNGEKQWYDPMVLFFGFIEKITYKRANKIIYSMLYGDKYICDKLGFPKDKVALIGQPLDCERFDEDAVLKEYLIPQDIINFIGDSFLCVFTGYYMDYEGVYVMLEAAKILKQKQLPIKMVFVGSGTEKDGMIKYMQENALNNVYVGDRISKEAIPALLRKADICMAHCATKDKEESFKYGISKNKVNEYLYSNSCIIYGRNDPEDPVSKFGAGFVVKPFSAEEFSEKIEVIYNMTKEERAVFAANGRNYAINYHRVDKLVDKLLEVYDFNN